MTSLLTTELRKLLPYRTFWIILVFYAVLLVLFMYSSSAVQINGQQLGPDFYRFPDIWMRLTYIASYFNLLLGILMITLITDEYAFRTFRQQVIDGLFRSDLVAAKFLVVGLIATVCTVFMALTGLAFGMSYTPAVSPALVFKQAMHLVYYLVQALGYMSLAVFLSFLIKRNGLAILLFLLYTVVLEPLAHWRLDGALDQYFPMKVFSSLTPTPGQEVLDSLTGPTLELSPQQAVLPALGYIAIFYCLSLLLLRARDL
jgi:ABC-2 type transport system permease protein